MCVCVCACVCVKASYDVWLPSKKMAAVITVQIQEKVICLSHTTNTLEKGMVPLIHTRAIDLVSLPTQARL